MTTSELTVRLAEHFGAYIASDPSLLTEATSICTHYGVTPEDLFYKWEAFAFNNKLSKSEPLTVDHARELRKIIATSVNASAVAGLGASEASAQTPLKPSSALNRGKIAGDFSAMLGIKGTPIKSSNISANAFQTPVRAASSTLNHSPFGGPGATPATASAYKPAAGMRDADVHMSDIDSPLRPAPAASSASTSKHPRYSILESLNEHLPLTGSGSQLAPPSSTGSKKRSSRVSLAMATDPKAWNYRYMFEKKGERSQVLDDRIDDYATLLRTAYSIDESDEFGDPSLPSQEPIWVVGRICPALPAPESSAGQALRAKASSRAKIAQDESVAFGLPKLAETGVVLESSRMMGSGNRTPIVFTKGCIVKHTPQDVGTRGAATTLSLFPGQIVMCRGINAGADKFSVNEICFPPPLPLAVHTAEEALDHNYSPNKLDGSALNIVAAAGPFTEDTDLEFSSWHKLMDEFEAGGIPIGAGETKRRGVPDTLVLTGPFISSKHPLLPFSTEMPAELFARHFSSRLSNLIGKYPGTMVVLIPSTHDILNVHSAYPQPSFAKEDATGPMGLPKQRVRCLPNPSVFYVNELVVGTTTADSLGDLKSEEMVTRIEASPTLSGSTVAAGSIAAKNKETNTRWSRCILSQRSFYPVYPPPTNSGIAYDTSHSHLLNFPAVTPDLLILPSAKIVKPFIRVVNSSTLIQPGPLTSGSIVSIHVNPLDKSELESIPETETIISKLYDRARIDIISL